MRDLELWDLISKLERDKIPHVIATVINVKGSTSAKAGSKALISAEGKNLWGWVGGGCAEAYVINESLETLKDGNTRIITADLDDEVFGLGMPCGGIMEIFLEPRLPPEKLSVKIENSPALQKLLNHFGFVVEQYGKNEGAQTEIILLSLARAICQVRGLKFRSILESRQKGERLPNLNPPTEFLILGHSRITEELAKLSILLRWPTRIYGLNMDKINYPSAAQAETALPDYAGLEIKENSYVLIASHHKGDAEYIRQALEANAAYIGMVASEKRANLVMDYLIAKGKTVEELQKVRSPAGIELNCKNPSEIALSIIAELLAENETYGKDKRSS